MNATDAPPLPDVPGPGPIFADRMGQRDYELAPPRLGANGSLIVEAVLAVPGVMDYPHGPTYVPPETLADSAWLDSLAGVPVTDDDQGAHFDGVTPDSAQRVGVGTVLDARWDDAQQAVIGRLAIHVRRAIDAIRRGVRGVSPAYRATLAERAGVAPSDGRRYTHVQTSRTAADNVAITPTPRGGEPAKLRADSMANEQTDTETVEQQATQATADASMDERMAKMQEAIDSLRADMAKMQKAASDADDYEGKPEADATPEPVVVKVAPVRALLRAADAHEVEVADDDTADSLRAKVARAILGDDADGLSADAVDVAIKLAPTKQTPDPLARVKVSTADANRTRTYLRGA